MQEAHPNREGRERAVELLYEADTKALHPADVVAGLPLAPHPYAAALAEGVGDHRHLLDHLIGARSRGWTVARMPTVDRTLLRMGTYELAFEPEQPEGVVISEAVALATRFSTDDSPKFVNGVLSAMVEQVRGGGPWRNVSCPLALLVDMDGGFVDAAVTDLVRAVADGGFATVDVGDGPEAAADAAGAAPGDCLLVDDRPELVVEALAVGMPAVAFHGAVRLDATLRRVGLLPGSTG